ncbi:hypothetical protein G3N94_16625 [Burkholderia sp. Ac-20353]|nr:hypothetical protein [Burkholderia sp. Ac-20353]
MSTPAMKSALAARSPLLAAAHAGTRIVAVGLRGDIVYSDDDGKSWKQASVPVSTDLVALSFSSDKQGWAVGHGGVVVHTSDAGATWVKQMDGARFSALTLDYYQKMADRDPSPEVRHAYEQAKALGTDGSTQALLDVHFDSDTTGFVVGTFNRIFRTEDGGKTWTPWMERTENPREFHFYSIRSDGTRTLLTGEQGMVWLIDPAKERLVPMQTPYKGTLFGSVLAGSNIFVFGMRGTIFRSSDGGTSWDRVSAPGEAGITGGVALDASGSRLLLVNQAGFALYSRDGGKSFEAVKFSHPMPYFGVGAGLQGELVLVGPVGVRVESLSVLGVAGGKPAQ